MNPIRRAGVLAFIDWLNRRHPEVRSLKELSEDEFLRLATQFEASKGLEIDSRHEVYRKWSSTYDMVRTSADDAEALSRLH